MLKVAITGNIGSGKSTVSKIFQTLGIPVFIADIEARLLYYEDDVKEEIRQYFGENVFNIDGEIDSKALAGVIFNDPAALKKINGIIHPRTLKKYNDWLDQHIDKEYTLHESAILFENKLQHHFDKTINVSAPQDLRAKRVMDRDGLTHSEVYARIKNQLPDKEKNSLADFIINNDGKGFLIPQVIEMDKILKSNI